MSKVTAADLKALLGSGQGTELVLEAGRILIVPPERAAQHGGAMTVASREDLRQRLGEGEPDERALEEQAEILTTQISQLGA
jgi:hypothetical protein